MMFSRRDFLRSASLFGAGFALAKPLVASEKIFTNIKANFDESLSVFFSDVHVGGGKSYQRNYFLEIVADVMRMDPLPRNIVIFGDLAFLSGMKGDYEESYKIIKPMMDLGIKVTIGMGNHDRRSTFLETYEGYDKRLLVPGKIVSVSSDSNADILMLDGLQGKDERAERDMGPVSGKLDPDQIEWIKAELPKWPRKVFVGSHFPIHELKIDQKTSLVRFMMENCPNVKGYIHGHDHRWYERWSSCGWGKRAIMRSVCLPSTGHWGDIGYTTFRTTPEKATLSLKMKDFFFPRPLKEGEKRPAIWDQFIKERSGTPPREFALT